MTRSVPQSSALLVPVVLLFSALVGCADTVAPVQSRGEAPRTPGLAASEDATDPSTPIMFRWVPPSASATSAMSPDVRVATIGELYTLMLEGKAGHDGAIWLKDHGDMSSVPALLKVLEDNQPPEGQSAVICTYGHASDALRAITGESELRTYDEWRAWWTQKQAAAD